MALKAYKTKPKNKTLGFTIVELLIVIVIIGILAAIVIVSYIGISKKATEAGLQSDLKGAKTQLELYKVEHGTYPTAMDANNCPVTPAIDNNYCINKSIAYTPVGGDGSSYDLVITRNNVSYQTTDTTPPFIIMPITGIGDITGTSQVGQTLTAGAITPTDATVSYQWQSATTSGGTYSNIAGATSNTLTLNPSNINKYIKVVASGTGVYTGTRTSAASNQVATDSNWKVIGNQVWATANLNVGTRIAGTTAQTDNTITEKYCYDNTESNCTIYGGLYQWDEVMNYSTTEGAQGICPAGTHIPSDNDWKILEVSLGMVQSVADTSGWRGTDQGTQLKSGGSSGLNMQFAGLRSTDGSFGLLSSFAYFWSNPESGPNAWYRNLSTSEASVFRGATSEIFGLSVRCLAN